MKIESEIPRDLRKCRLCFKDKKVLLYIFEVSGSLKNVARTLCEVLNYEVALDDHFPPFVCSDCSDKLHGFKCFKEKCDRFRETYELFLKTKAESTSNEKLILWGVKKEEESDVVLRDHLDNLPPPHSAETFQISLKADEEEIEVPVGDEDFIVKAFPIQAVDNTGNLDPLADSEEDDLNADNGSKEVCDEEEVDLPCDEIPFIVSAFPVEANESSDEAEEEISHPAAGPLLSEVPDRVLRSRKMIDYKLNKSASDVSNAESSDTFHPSDQDDGPSTEDNLNSVRYFKRQKVSHMLTAKDQIPLSEGTLQSTISKDSISPCISVQRTSRDSIQEKQLKRPREEGSIYEGISMLDFESFGITLEKETDDPGPSNKRGSNPEGEPQPLEQNADKDRHMQSSNSKLLGSLSTAVPENVMVLKVVDSLANPASEPDNRKKGFEVDRKTELVDSDTSSAGSEDEGSDQGDLDGEKTVKKKPRMEYLCEHCGKVCSNSRTLYSHRKYVHGEKTIECKKCSKMFNMKSQLTQHYKYIHSEERPFSCTQCGSRFKQKGYLKEHMLVHSKKQMYQCVHCEMGFRRKWQHDNHQASHEGEVVWSCNGCEEKSKTWADYLNHLLEHKKNIMYKCDTCSKAFNTKEALKRHILRHIKPFECSVCGKHFGLRKILKNHMRVHTGEKPYECKLCEKRFFTHDSRYVHMKSHSDARPFKCRFCYFRCKNKGYMRKHENSRHKNHN